jgi:hypothetical protein
MLSPSICTLGSYFGRILVRWDQTEQTGVQARGECITRLAAQLLKVTSLSNDLESKIRCMLTYCSFICASLV